ncbi:DNA repair protein REV1 isoform X2 [Primulina tabacum]|uniref:DNA repair protein REV1 isoform X2 n=1 Tax=Primulina tabacum TaxID=48773 RepID=UPI003F59125C
MSSNSGSKSKRSFNSIPSNNSSRSSNDRNAKNRKKAAQKTLGMAWGANSHSSSLSAFGNSPFSDFGSYMAVKNQKLHEQFDAAASSSSRSDFGSGRSIFSGVSIFVDGYTVPSSQELRGYMLKYGGHFENYFSRRHVTHIICSNLPNSKIKNLRAFSGGLPVVKPKWVLDSVAANELLSWIPYQLEQVITESDYQPKLSTFFTVKNSRVSDIESSFLDGQEMTENGKPSWNRIDSSLSEEHKSLEQGDQSSVQLDDPWKGNIDNSITKKPACSIESHCEIRPMSSTCEVSDEVSSLRTNLPPNQRHSTLTDPNFVDNYFKSSRLHFIGTWRNRYRNRFPSSSSGFTHKNSIHDSAAKTQKTVIVHVDLDCFFVSVVIRNHPELQNKPVAVCHSDNPRGTAEISSANYPARDHGVKAGMFVKDAKVRCPQLFIVPYDFGAYEKVADQFYEILHKHCNKVQAVSCDEAFLDISESEVEDPLCLSSGIRKEIFDTTGCTVSAGISSNMLMARLATKSAKPNGQYYLPPEKVDDYLYRLPVKALPGIGHVLEEKLKKIQVETCGELRLISKESLQKDFGMKTGEMLWNYSRGIDNRVVGVIQESKSIGAEVNWGVRFRNMKDTQHFLTNLCKEVSLRLQGCGVQGRSFTLKIKKRRADSVEPVKYMGCGDCENLSHSISIPVATDDVGVLQRLATKLFGYFHIDVRDIRGMGLQVSKLEGSDESKQVQKRNSILSWLAASSKKERVQSGDLSNRGDAGTGLSSSEIATLPPLHDLDMTVIKSLPPEVVSEINDMYGGKLFGFVSENKGKIVNTSISCDALFSGIKFYEKESCHAHPVKSNTTDVGNEEEDLKGKGIVPELSFNLLVKDEKIQCGDEATPVSVSSSVSPKALMPTSLSQVDCSALQQLPEELRKDILEHFPAHRPESVKGSSSNSINNWTDFGDLESDINLWIGNAPQWVDKFKTSSSCMLNLFAKMYQSRPCGRLSSLLQHIMSEINVSSEVSDAELDIAASCMYALFKQYVDLKIETDLEEIHFCLCLLRRLTERSKLFGQVYNSILPHLQASMSECYGGTLNIPSMKN